MSFFRVIVVAIAVADDDLASDVAAVNTVVGDATLVVVGTIGTTAVVAVVVADDDGVGCSTKMEDELLLDFLGPSFLGKAFAGLVVSKLSNCL